MQTYLFLCRFTWARFGLDNFFELLLIITFWKSFPNIFQEYLILYGLETIFGALRIPDSLVKRLITYTWGDFLLLVFKRIFPRAMMPSNQTSLILNCLAPAKNGEPSQRVWSSKPKTRQSNK